jgi:hypothetical protein
LRHSVCFGWFLAAISTNFGSDNHKAERQSRATTIRNFVFCSLPGTLEVLFAACVDGSCGSHQSHRHTETAHRVA